MKSTILSIAIAAILGVPLSVATANAHSAPRYILPEHTPTAQEIVLPSAPDVPEEKTYTEADVYFLAGVIWAEAGNQDDKGLRLVGSVVLNRVDDERFPNTIKGVVYQSGQFAVVRNGRLAKGLALQDERCIAAARAELEERTDSRLIYFCSTGYVNGTPLYKYGDHYFSY